MKLVAAMLVKNEYGRYLVPSLAHLCGFCDEIRVLDDGSTDDWADKVGRLGFGAPTVDLDRLHVLRTEQSVFFDHEGDVRNALLAWAYQGNPTHVLVIDADEFVSDGPALRRLLEAQPLTPAFTLTMKEIWKAADECLCVRDDGQWGPRPVPIVYRAPTARETANPRWRVHDRKLAPGREPVAVRDLQRTRRAPSSGVDVLHFGWTNEADRSARHGRYLEHDRGRFHNNLHLQSIMWDDRRVGLYADPWPDPLRPVRADVLRSANSVPVGADHDRL